MTADTRQARSRKPAGGQPSAVAPVRLRRLNRRQVEGVRENLADLYAESRATAPGDACLRPSRQSFLDRLTTDMRRPGFAMVIGETDSVADELRFPGRSGVFLDAGKRSVVLGGVWRPAGGPWAVAAGCGAGAHRVRCLPPVAPPAAVLR